MKWSLPVGWTAFSAACAASLVATTRFLFPNVLFEPPQSFKAGFPGEYNVGEVDVRWKDAYGVWIVREPDQFYAIIAVCTHLGCSPNWLSTENKFKCPCHGSGFYRTGINFEGPAPRPLERARIALADDGQILVDKSVKFQQEKGEWEKPESFLKV
jgi:cytochrome b6-f complex iron-sulfur subunit